MLWVEVQGPAEAGWNAAAVEDSLPNATIPALVLGARMPCPSYDMGFPKLGSRSFPTF